jgi:hypothetical protein
VEEKGDNDGKDGFSSTDVHAFPRGLAVENGEEKLAVDECNEIKIPLNFVLDRDGRGMGELHDALEGWA